MGKYDELLVRLDNLIRTHEGKLIDCHDAAAAIRELEAKLDAERKAREEADQRAEAAEAKLASVRADTIEKCAKVCEKRAYERFGEFGTTEHDTGATYYGGKAGEIYESMDEEDDDCAKAIRALAPERTEEGKEKNYTPDEVIDVLEHAFIPVDYKKKMALFELIDALKRPDEPAAAQELPVPIQSPGRDGAASSMPLVTQYPASAATPASPLLPGLERAAESIERRKAEWAALDAVIQTYSDDYEYGEDGYTPSRIELAICYDFLQGLIANDDFLAAIAQVYPVRSKFAAEISRLKGEGSES